MRPSDFENNEGALHWGAFHFSGDVPGLNAPFYCITVIDGLDTRQIEYPTMYLRLSGILLITALIAPAASITIEQPFTLNLSETFITRFEDGYLWDWTYSYERYFWFDTGFVFQDYYSQLPTGVTFTGASAKVDVQSATWSTTDIDDGLAVQMTYGGIAGMGNEYLVFNSSGEVNCWGQTYYHDTPSDLGRCVNDMVQPGARVISTTWGPGPTGIVGLYFVSVTGTPPQSGSYAHNTSVNYSASGVYSLTFTYTDPNAPTDPDPTPDPTPDTTPDPTPTPEPSTWFMTASVAAAAAVLRLRRF